MAALEYEEVGPPADFVLVPCAVCGRNFKPESLAKHQRICDKATRNSKRRGKFNSGAARARALGIKVKTSAETAAAKPEERAIKAKKNQAWRAKHQDFIASIRAARQVQKVLDNGGDIRDLPPPPASINPDYVQCPHCSRRFQETTAARHIPFCAEKAKRAAIKSGTGRTKSAAVQRRTSYKPPPPGPKRTPSRAAARNGSGGGGGGGDSSRTDSPRRPMNRASGFSRRSTTGSAAQGPSARRTPSRGTPGSVREPARSSESRASRRSDCDSPGCDDRAGSSRSTSRAGPARTLGPVYGRVGSASSTGSGSASHQKRGRYCGHCGQDLHASSVPKFCVECGARFAVDRAKFCGECGAKRL